MRNDYRLIFFLVLGLLQAGAFSELGRTSAEEVLPFLEKHCFDCHDADTARAGFRIDLLTADFTAGNNAGLWHEVMNKINSGQMPPKRQSPRQLLPSRRSIRWLS